MCVANICSQPSASLVFLLQDQEASWGEECMCSFLSASEHYTQCTENHVLSKSLWKEELNSTHTENWGSCPVLRDVRIWRWIKPCLCSQGTDNKVAVCAPVCACCRCLPLTHLGRDRGEKGGQPPDCLNKNKMPIHFLSSPGILGSSVSAGKARPCLVLPWRLSSESCFLSS